MVLEFVRLFCVSVLLFFFFKQKTAYEMRISDWSSDVCSSDLRTVNQVRYPAYVVDSLCGQLRPTARAEGGIPPAFDRFIDRLHRRLVRGVGREIIEHPVTQPIAGADLHLVQPVEHVELGESDSGDSGNRHRLPDQHCVEPAATTLAAGEGAELVAAFAQQNGSANG